MSIKHSLITTCVTQNQTHNNWTIMFVLFYISKDRTREVIVTCKPRKKENGEAKYEGRHKGN